MSGYTGDFADAKLIHTLDSKDADVVGPGAWTNSGVTFTTVNARFGENIFSEAIGAGLLSDSAIAGLDDSDGKKLLMHTFFVAPDLAGVKTPGGIVDSAASLNRARMFFFSGAVNIEWNRKTDLGVGLPTVRVASNTGKIVIDTQHSLVGFVDSGDLAEGKIFIDGVDETSSVANISVASPAGILGHALIGNHVIGLGSDQYVDDITFIQSDSLDDAKVALLAPQYHDTRGFGYRPTFLSTDISLVQAGDIVNLIGSGFGKDVTITVEGVTALNIVRVSESSISFEVPPGLGTGSYDLAITNVAANVTFTQTAALSEKVTTWTAGGTSDRQARVGDGQTVSADWLIGGPTRWCDPNIVCTPWVKTCKC